MGLRYLALFDVDGTLLVQGSLMEDSGHDFSVKGGLAHNVWKGVDEVTVLLCELWRDLQF
jgi:hypothetical protein